jgi:hypothetical protein
MNSTLQHTALRSERRNIRACAVGNVTTASTNAQWVRRQLVQPQGQISVGIQFVHEPGLLEKSKRTAKRSSRKAHDYWSLLYNLCIEW